MNDVKREIEMETKDICDLFEKLVSKTRSHFDMGLDNIDTDEAYKIIDMIKDLAETKEKLVKCMYHTQIMQAMEDHEYGEEWDENGRVRAYTPSPSTHAYNNNMGGRHYYRDMDKNNKNVMYYTDPMMNREWDYNTTEKMGKYYNARKGYEEKADMKSLNAIFDVIEEDMQELKPMMSTTDTQTAKTRLTNLANML